MAIMDGLLTFDSAAAITTSRASTNTVDLAVARDLGVDTRLKILVLIVSPFAGGTSVVVQFQGSPDNATWTTYAESSALPTANLTAGNMFPIDVPRPPPGVAIPRYWRMNYNVTGTYTAGAVTATIVRDAGAHIYYPPGIAIYN